MVEISRRQFLKGSGAAAGTLIVPWKNIFSFLDSQIPREGWVEGQRYRNAVVFPMAELKRLNGTGVSGDDKLVGDEEMLLIEKKSGRELRYDKKRAREFLIKWAREKCIEYKVKPKEINFSEMLCDFDTEFGIGIEVIT